MVSTHIRISIKFIKNDKQHCFSQGTEIKTRKGRPKKDKKTAHDVGVQGGLEVGAAEEETDDSEERLDTQAGYALTPGQSLTR